MLSKPRPAEIRFIRQPNGYSCGSTCVAMVATAAKGLPSLRDPVEVMQACGTNPDTGTTEVEMARALSQEKLAYARGAARSLNALRDEIDAGRYVLLRTLINNVKHWVVVDGYMGRKHFEVVCPTVGRTRWACTHLWERWKARGFDHFLVPGSQWDQAPAHRAIHEQDFLDFIRHSALAPPDAVTDYEQSSIAIAKEAIIERGVIDPLQQIVHASDRWLFFRETLVSPAFNIRARSSGYYPRTWSAMFVATVDAPRTPVAGIYRGVPVVREDLQGQGIGTEMVLAAHNDGPHRYLEPSTLSESGLRARISAHAEAIRRAVAAGLPVRDNVVQSNPKLNPDAMKNIRVRQARAPSPQPSRAAAKRPARRKEEQLDMFRR